MTFRTICAALAAAGLAPAAAYAEPAATPIDAQSHYSGVWLEVGRTPMAITKGCVAGTTTYSLKDSNQVAVVDDCRQGGVTGKRKAISGRGLIEDPGVNRRLKVTYAAFITWRYEVLERDPQGGWFISADPGLKKIFLYTRKPPSEALLAHLVSRARALGYNGEIETPAPLP